MIKRKKIKSILALLSISTFGLMLASCSNTIHNSSSPTPNNKSTSLSGKISDTDQTKKQHRLEFTNVVNKIFKNKKIKANRAHLEKNYVASELQQNIDSLSKYYDYQLPASITIDKTSVKIKTNQDSIFVQFDVKNENESVHVSFLILGFDKQSQFENTKKLFPDKVHSKAYSGLSIQDALNKIVPNGEFDQLEFNKAYGKNVELPQGVKLTYSSSEINELKTVIEFKFAYTYKQSNIQGYIIVKITGFEITIDELAQQYQNLNANAITLNGSNITAKEVLVNPKQYFQIKIPLIPKERKAGLAILDKVQINEKDDSKIDYTYNINLADDSTQPKKATKITITVSGFYKFAAPPKKTAGIANKIALLNQDFYTGQEVTKMKQVDVNHFIKLNWSNSIAYDINNILRLMFSRYFEGDAQTQIQLAIIKGYENGSRNYWTPGYLIAHKLSWIGWKGDEITPGDVLKKIKPTQNVTINTNIANNSSTFNWNWYLNEFDISGRDVLSRWLTAKIDGAGNLNFTLSSKTTISQKNNKKVVAKVLLKTSYSQVVLQGDNIFTRKTRIFSKEIEIPIGDILYWYFHQTNHFLAQHIVTSLAQEFYDPLSKGY